MFLPREANSIFGKVDFLIKQVSPIFRKIGKKLRGENNSKLPWRYFLQTFSPSLIMRNGRTDKKWDKELNEILENPESIRRDGLYTILLNGNHVWVANYPYAYGSRNGGHGLPARKTVVKLKMVIDAFEAEEDKQRGKSYDTFFNID